MIIKTTHFLFWKCLNLNKLVFKDDSVDLSNYKIEYIRHKLSYDESLKYFINIQKIIHNLERNNMTISSIEETDFVLLDNNMYIINDKFVVPLKNNYFTLTTPIKSSVCVIPPEFKYEIPITLYKSFCYYMICTFFINTLEYEMNHICHTPLYFSLKRGIHDNPLKRFLIII
jgi:hypothetical protein